MRLTALPASSLLVPCVPGMCAECLTVLGCWQWQHSDQVPSKEVSQGGDTAIRRHTLTGVSNILNATKFISLQDCEWERNHMKETGCYPFAEIANPAICMHHKQGENIAKNYAA